MSIQINLNKYDPEGDMVVVPFQDRIEIMPREEVQKEGWNFNEMGGCTPEHTAVIEEAIKEWNFDKAVEESESPRITSPVVPHLELKDTIKGDLPQPGLPEIAGEAPDPFEKITDSPAEAAVLHDIVEQSPVILELIEKIKERDREGFKTFGGSLDDRAMDVTGWLEEAIEETIDLLAYLMKAKQELQKKLDNRKSSELMAAVNLLNDEIDKLED